jgi:dipeptidyl aminopeptidase/acylaminoacyl peptidase
VDGAQVHAWEIKPVGYEAGKQYPVVVYVHCSMFSWDFNHDFQCLANAGYVVAYFNQRGTTAGYGQAHALGNYYGKHLAEFEETMVGVDDLVKRPYVDGARMGVTGGSCGGFMTNWVVGHTDRFAAAVTQRSVVDLVSKFGTSDNGPEQAESEGASPPWADVERLWQSSPLAYAPNVHTPLLIIHSDEDHRCSLSQAEELFAALRWLGCEVEMVIFQGESHFLAQGGRPGNRIERQKRILGWFRKYLGTIPNQIMV